MQLLARTLLTWMKLDNRGVSDMGCYAHMKGPKNSRILLYFYCFFELQHFIDVLICVLISIVILMILFLAMFVGFH